MTLEATNGTAWIVGVQNGFTDLGIDSEDALAALAKDISRNMRDDAPTMEAEERARRQSQPQGPENVRKRPGKTTIRYTRARDKQGFYIDVGPNKGAFYLAFIEYGTRFLSARPFLRPAIEKAVASWASAGSKP